MVTCLTLCSKSSLMKLLNTIASLIEPSPLGHWRDLFGPKKGQLRKGEMVSGALPPVAQIPMSFVKKSHFFETRIV